MLWIIAVNLVHIGQFMKMAQASLIGHVLIAAITALREKEMTLYEFHNKVEERVKTTGERKGQAAFNLLHEIRPELANMIRGTDADPFYTHENWKAFIRRIEFLWCAPEAF